MNFIDNFTKYNLPNLGWTRLPVPPITKEDRIRFGSSENESNSKFLSRLCHYGFEQKLKNGQIPKEKYNEYINRCKYELDTFDELYFTDYILLIWKIVDKAKEIGVFIDWGRGSIVSSVVSWFLGITGCDPIKFNLFFSRFVSKARAKSKIINGEVWLSNELIADADINVSEGLDVILKWLDDIYPNRICRISTVNTFTGKILLKDVYKCYEEVSEDESQEIADMVERHFGVVQDIENVYQENDKFQKWANKHNETYNICLSLRELYRNIGIHASGYLISFEELNEHTPLILNADGEITSIYTMDNTQCLKVDLLGLDTNSMIKKILEKIPEKVEEINLEDNPFIYDKFQNKNLLPYGLYQISSPTAYRVCEHLKPKNVMEMSHVSALSRPVALPYERAYIEKSGKCPHPLFEKALNWTNWQPLYQEQTLMCLKAIGFSEEEAEMARRTFAKKHHEETEKQVELVKKKIKENNLPDEVGEIVIKLAEDGAKYQFNLSHSLAISYLSSLTTYLKYKYPLQFYLVCLNMVKITSNAKMTPVEKIHTIKNEMAQFNIKLLPPHILKSDLDFKIDGENIRFGLSAIKNIAFKNFEKLRNFCHEYANKFEIFSSAQQIGLNLGILNSLIYSGCLDDYLTDTRSKTANEANLYSLLTPKEKIRVLELGKTFNYNLVEIVKYLSKPQNGSDKSFIKESRLKTLRRDYGPYQKIYNQNSQNEELNAYWWESKLLGYSYSYRLFDILKKNYSNIIPIQEAKTKLDNESVTVGGQIIEYKEGKSKNKNKYIKMTISDGDSIDVLLMEKNFEQNDILNHGKKFTEDNIVLINGQKKGDIIFANKIINQNVKIIQSVSEIKNT